VLQRNPVLVTALNPLIGYQNGARIAKRAWAEGRPIRDVAAEETGLDPERLGALLDALALTAGGIRGGGGGVD
jgi:fumarate hydratase class II